MRIATKLLSISLGLVLLPSLLTGCNRGPSDESLTQNVQAKLKADSALAAAHVVVNTTNGTVTLTGEVNSEGDKSRAEQLAKGVEGVKAVTNSLVIKPPVPVISKDDPLKSQVTASLAKYGITGVTVAVANGEVTLTGEIPRAKLQDALKAANEAHPRKVNNRLTIK